MLKQYATELASFYERRLKEFDVTRAAVFPDQSNLVLPERITPTKELPRLGLSLTVDGDFVWSLGKTGLVVPREYAISMITDYLDFLELNSKCTASELTETMEVLRSVRIQ